MHNPSLEKLMHESFPQLAAALRERTPHILERFRELVKELLPSADELTLKDLRNSLPEAMEHMAVLLGASGSGKAHWLLADSKEHGAIRYHQSFNLNEVLVEYSILRGIIFEELTVAIGRHLEMDEIASLNGVIDAANRRATESFVLHQSHQLRIAVESQTKYLSFLSHDLRGGLNGILLMLEVLRRELVGMEQFKESVEDMELMRRSILDTVATMDRFLHAEKFRHGKIEVKLGPVNLAGLLNAISGQFHSQAKDKGITISVETDRCPQVISDRELISLIVQNLIGNAIKYSKSGQVKVVAGLSPQNAPLVSISDQGFGIAPDKLKDIFAPFTRGDTHGQKGIGLGLSIAVQAAELLKAKLWADSEVGKGSTFYLELPASALKAEEKMAENERDDKPTLDYASPRPAAPNRNKRLFWGIIGLLVYAPVTLLASMGVIVLAIRKLDSRDEPNDVGAMTILVLLALFTGLRAWASWDQIKGRDVPIDP